MLIGAAAIAALAAAAPAQERSSTTLAVPGRASAYVSLASRGSFTAAVWAGSTESGASDIYMAASRDGGASFSAPVRVNSTAGDVRVNGEQPPRVTLVPRSGAAPDAVVIWTAPGDSGTRLKTSVSRDGGRTFEPARLVPGSDAAGNRGWEAIGNDGRRPFAVWLDHRQLAAREPGARHQHGGAAGSAAASADGVAMAQLSQLFFAPLDGSSRPRSLTGGVCYCCKTALAAGARGELYLAWRHVYPGNLRDIAFSASRDGGASFSAPVRVSEDRWAINGCPDDGPAMAVDAAGGVHVVWPTVVSEGGAPVKALFHAVSRDGLTFGPRTRIPAEGFANHPQIAAATDGSVMVAWDESGGGSRRIAWAQGVASREGSIAFTRTAVSGGQGVYPAITAASRGPLLAWTAGEPAHSVIQLARIP